MRKILKKENGITLVALVVTIIVLIILAGVSINLILGDNGIITIAKRSKENIELAKIEEEKELNELYMQLEDNEENTGDVESGDLKAELAQTNATADKILKDYKAYSQGKLLTGIMENYAGQTVTASKISENGDNAEITIPSEGYYGTDSKVSIPIEEIEKYFNTINSGYKGYIFKEGAFANNSFEANGFYGASGSATINNEYLEIKGVGNGGTGRRQYVILQNPIDLTNINGVYIELEESKLYCNFKILFSTTKPTSYSSDPTSQNSRYVSYNTELVNVVYCTNTSKLSGNYYMTIYLDGSSVSTDYFDAFIKTIAYK